MMLHDMEQLMECNFCSADAVEDKQTGMSYYLVDVTLEGELFEDDGSKVEILPGMVASVDVLAGKRTY